MSDFHIVVIFNDYYILIVAFLTKQIQNRYRRLPDTQVLCVCVRTNLSNYAGLITARKRSLGQGNIFTPVCHSVHRGGGST